MPGGKLNPNIIQIFKNKFEENCILLLIESYNQIIPKNSLKEQSENNITACLAGLMLKHPRRLDLMISIQRESYYDDKETYQGIKDANESVRIDIKFVTWSSNIEYVYFLEAKNLSENNWTKSYNNAKVNSHKQLKRYIDTGIQNFITGGYPNGSLIGYVVEGNPNNIVQKINDILTQTNRSAEHLSKNSEARYDFNFISIHSNYKLRRLNHFMLEFC